MSFLNNVNVGSPEEVVENMKIFCNHSKFRFDGEFSYDNIQLFLEEAAKFLESKAEKEKTYEDMIENCDSMKMRLEKPIPLQKDTFGKFVILSSSIFDETPFNKYNCYKTFVKRWTPPLPYNLPLERKKVYNSYDIEKFSDYHQILSRYIDEYKEYITRSYQKFFELAEEYQKKEEAERMKEVLKAYISELEDKLSSVTTEKEFNELFSNILSNETLSSENISKIFKGFTYSDSWGLEVMSQENYKKYIERVPIDKKKNHSQEEGDTQSQEEGDTQESQEDSDDLSNSDEEPYEPSSLQEDERAFICRREFGASPNDNIQKFIEAGTDATEPFKYYHKHQPRLMERDISPEENNMIFGQAGYPISCYEGECYSVLLKYGTIINFFTNGLISIDQRYMNKDHSGVLYQTMYQWNTSTGEITLIDYFRDHRDQYTKTLHSCDIEYNLLNDTTKKFDRKMIYMDFRYFIFNNAFDFINTPDDTFYDPKTFSRKHRKHTKSEKCIIS